MSFFPLPSAVARSGMYRSTTSSGTVALKDRLILVTSGTGVNMTLPSPDVTGFDSQAALFFTLATWGSGVPATLSSPGSNPIGGSGQTRTVGAYSSITVTAAGSDGWVIVATSGSVT